MTSAKVFVLVGSVLTLCLLVAADPVPETTVAPEAATEPIHTMIENGPNDGEKPGCSSNDGAEQPCGLTGHPGIFSWVSDTRKYEWIYMAFCITLGSCIFLFVISAAIYNQKVYKKKQQRLLAHIQEEDERARAATVHTERRGSHLAQPRRSSLSVAIQEPHPNKR